MTIQEMLKKEGWKFALRFLWPFEKSYGQWDAAIPWFHQGHFTTLYLKGFLYRLKQELRNPNIQIEVCELSYVPFFSRKEGMDEVARSLQKACYGEIQTEVDQICRMIKSVTVMRDGKIIYKVKDKRLP